MNSFMPKRTDILGGNSNLGKKPEDKPPPRPSEWVIWKRPHEVIEEIAEKQRRLMEYDKEVK